MLDLPFTEPEKTEEEKRGMGVGEEQAFCLGHTDFEMPIINPNENVNVEYTSLELKGEIQAGDRN